MLFDAGTIFDRNAVAFDEAIGTPESSLIFREEYIAPIIEASSQDGRKMEAAYMAAVCDCQREGFIVGFRAVVQLMIDCMSTEALEKHDRVLDIKIASS